MVTAAHADLLAVPPCNSLLCFVAGGVAISPEHALAAGQDPES